MPRYCDKDYSDENAHCFKAKVKGSEVTIQFECGCFYTYHCNGGNSGWSPETVANAFEHQRRVKCFNCQRAEQEQERKPPKKMGKVA